LRRLTVAIAKNIRGRDGVEFFDQTVMARIENGNLTSGVESDVKARSATVGEDRGRLPLDLQPLLLLNLVVPHSERKDFAIANASYIRAIRRNPGHCTREAAARLAVTPGVDDSRTQVLLRNYFASCQIDQRNRIILNVGRQQTLAIRTDRERAGNRASSRGN
jgi:hypothetical protein